MRAYYSRFSAMFIKLFNTSVRSCMDDEDCCLFEEFFFFVHFKNDINERTKLQAPMIRKGLVFYIHTNIAPQRLENTTSFIASILQHSAGSSVTTNT